ncbi:MAG: hypothetical protein QOF39_3603, partial [Frankiales bacterium]|nr:hypothetical protein [Frankiales bacterium]
MSDDLTPEDSFGHPAGPPSSPFSPPSVPPPSPPSWLPSPSSDSVTGPKARRRSGRAGIAAGLTA